MPNEWDKARAQKRGGGVPLLPLEFDTAETRYSREPADNVTPEQHFERRWALTLLETVLNRLRTEYEQDGKAELFAALNPCLVGDRTVAALRGAGGEAGHERRRRQIRRASVAPALPPTAARGDCAAPSPGRARWRRNCAT